MILNLYTKTTNTIIPLLNWHLNRRVKKGKEDKARLDERRGISSIKRPAGPLIWIHTASVGEAQSALPMLKPLLSKHPKLHILFTSGTVTAAQLLADRLPERVIHQYIPLDTQKWVRSFLNHWRPNLALWVESELWPNLVIETKKRKIPMVLLNGRLSEQSFSMWKKLPKFINKLLSSFDLCLAQSEEQTKRFKSLGAKNVSVIGNLKAASDPLPVDEKKLKILEAKVHDRPIWLAASTHQGEDSLALDVHKILKEKYPDLLTIIVPRHVQRAKEIRTEIREHHFRFAQRSKKELPVSKTDIYLADTMGELGIFYRLANIVFVGGSYPRDAKTGRAWGGHNPLEPAILRCAITFGTDMSNCRGVADALLCGGSAREIKNAEELSQVIGDLLIDQDLCDKQAESAYCMALHQKDVLYRLLDTLKPFVDNLLDHEKFNAAS
jgi:3-deoxy-D-manno-octulosonic-acid transferase